MKSFTQLSIVSGTMLDTEDTVIKKDGLCLLGAHRLVREEDR